MHQVRVGFIPLIDCAVIVAAHEMGFASRNGIRLNLSREPSWASIRDKVAFGVLDAAHMLAPMPSAMSLGLGGDLEVPMLAPIGLGHGGNAITVSKDLYQEMLEADPDALTGPAGLSARSLPAIARQRRADGRGPLRFAAVFPFSAHFYELRLWLAAGGVGEEDVTIQIIPPPRMVESMATGQIDGFCVGEPWNHLAESQRLGKIVATKSDVAPGAPEKVLGLTRAFAESHPETVSRLLDTLSEAASWASTHHADLADILSSCAYVGVDRTLIQHILDTHTGPYMLDARPLSGGQVEWLHHQMQAWGQIRPDTDGDFSAIYAMPTPAHRHHAATMG